jgi:signal transduction histidine kinase
MDSATQLTNVAQRLDAAVVALGRDLSVAQREENPGNPHEGEDRKPLSQFADALRERSRELEEINRDLENFIWTIAHDLRSPLRSVVGTSQMLLEDFGAILPDEAADLLKRQVDAGKRMSSMVDDLVQYTRLGQGTPEKLEFDLTLMAQDVSHELAERQWTHGLHFIIEPGMRIEGFPGLVRLILQNLLENAAKFTTGIRDALIEVGSIQGPQEKIYFVKDNGPGFSQYDAAQIFEPFVRLAGEHYSGNGIGLANARKAVSRHGGRMWAESSVDSGATFLFTLS